jgi:DNA polymerase III delta prime subunit
LKHNYIMNYLQLFYYKQSHNIYNLLRHKNHPNLLLYNQDENQTLIMIQTILNDKFNIIYPKLLINENYSYNSYYYIINCFSLNMNKLDIIDQIIKNYDYYRKNYKYIILINFDKTIELIQQRLQILIEKSYQTSKFIIITNSLNRIIYPLKSRLCCIRIKPLSKHDTYIHFKQISDYDNHHLKEICDKNYSYNEILYKFTNQPLLQTMIQNIFKIYQSKHMKIHTLKEICYKIKLLGIKKETFLQTFLQNIIQQYKHISHEKLYKIIHYIALYDLYLQKSYRDIIYFESLLLKIYKIIYL